MESEREIIVNGNARREAWEDGPPPGFGDAEGSGAQGGPAEPSSSTWAARVTPVTEEWLSTPPPRRVWLLRDGRRPQADGVLPLGKVGSVIAEGGVGKTMALAQLACAVATGDKWLGTLTAATTGRVLLVLGEEDAEETRRRLFNAARATGGRGQQIAANVVTLPLAGLPCSMVDTVERNPVDGAFLNWLREYLAANGPWSLIAIDPLSRFAGMQAETDNAAATRFVQALESIATATGATVLASHHTNKPSRGDGATVDTSSSRGSSALTDGVRWVATLGTSRIKLEDPDVQERLGEIVTLSFTKSNYGRKADPIVLRRDLDNGGALVPLDDADREMVAAEREAAAPQAQRSARRQAELADRRAREDAFRAEKERARGERLAAERLAQDRALVALLRERPGIGAFDLRAALAAKLGSCAKDTCAAVVARLGAAVRIARPEGGSHNARGHWLDEDRLPAHLTGETT